MTSWDKVFEADESKIQNIISAASSLWIENAVDPAVCNNDFFNQADTMVTISTSDNKKYVIHLAEKDGNSYIKKEDSPTVYKIATYERKKLSPDMNGFLKIELPKIKELAGFEMLDYKVDPHWMGKQIAARQLEETDKSVRIHYDKEAEKAWIRFDDNNTVLAFDKILYEKLSNEKKDEKGLKTPACVCSTQTGSAEMILELNVAIDNIL